MIVYLSSHIGGSYKQTDGTRMPAKLSTENGLLESLQEQIGIYPKEVHQRFEK